MLKSSPIPFLELSLARRLFGTSSSSFKYQVTMIVRYEGYWELRTYLGQDCWGQWFALTEVNPDCTGYHVFQWKWLASPEVPVVDHFYPWLP